jgi:hypothetical protein
LRVRIVIIERAGIIDEASQLHTQNPDQRTAAAACSRLGLKRFERGRREKSRIRLPKRRLTLALVHIHRRDQRRRLPKLDFNIEAIANDYRLPPLNHTKAGRADFAARPADP